MVRYADKIELYPALYLLPILIEECKNGTLFDTLCTKHGVKRVKNDEKFGSLEKIAYLAPRKINYLTLKHVCLSKNSTL